MKSIKIISVILLIVFIVKYNNKMNNYLVCNENEKLIEIKSNSISYNDDNIVINYPSLYGFNDKDLERKVNEMLISEALRRIQPIENIPKEIFYNLSYDIMLHNNRLLSVVYTGFYFAKTAPHPIDIFYSINIDLLNANKLRLKDIVTDMNELYKVYEFVINQGNDDEMTEFLYNYTMKNYNKAEVIKWFNESDETYKSGRRVFSYLTNNSIGISWEVPHSAGDHVEVEIPLKLISNLIFTLQKH